MDCVFCKVANKEIPAHIIYEDDHAVGILDIKPIAPGHAMILPKAHAENILDLGSDDVGPVFEAVKKVTGILKDKLSPDGFTIGINHGKVSGQTVGHLHIHIIPRWYDDGGGSVHSVVNNQPNEEEFERIRKELT